ncbi:MAG: 50S ribosomal protein L17 [Actinobacteria bacterium]|nr:50S ribosomal protein L17 [Actinomycetota bacterium]
MRHLRRGRHLGRTPAQRRALLRALVRSLILHAHINTTQARAKEVRGEVDALITLAKRGGLHARRQAIARMPDADAIQRLFDDLADQYAARPGGYTRIYRMGHRLGDGAPLVRLELV